MTLSQSGHVPAAPDTRLQQYKNCELPDVQAGFIKSRGIRGQIAHIHRIIDKAREFHRNICFCFIHCAKTFDCVHHNKLWKIIRYHYTPVRMAAVQKSTSNKWERVWRKGNPLTLLVGMQTSTAAMENSVEISLKTGNRTAI